MQKSKNLLNEETHPLLREVTARLSERLADVKRDFPRRIEWKCEGTPPFDLITSTLSLQNEADLFAALQAIHAALAQDGLFLGVVLGRQSLRELRFALTEAETALKGGASPRVQALPDAQDLSRLMPKAGFALPVVDVEHVTLDYRNLNDLMQDLRAHGCANALKERSKQFAPRALFEKAQEIYAQAFPSSSGGLQTTIELVFLHGWHS